MHFNQRFDALLVHLLARRARRRTNLLALYVHGHQIEDLYPRGHDKKGASRATPSVKEKSKAHASGPNRRFVRKGITCNTSTSKSRKKKVRGYVLHDRLSLS